MKTKTKFAYYLILATLLALGVIGMTNLILNGVSKTKQAIHDYFEVFNVRVVDVFVPGARAKEYAYNERVPEHVILVEMDSLGDRFHFTDTQMTKWKNIIRCEATGDDGKLDNLVCNPTSTACGIGQYLIRTWYSTESWKQYRIARTDYKAMLWEMALDLNSGQESMWQECLDILGYKDF